MFRPRKLTKAVGALGKERAGQWESGTGKVVTRVVTAGSDGATGNGPAEAGPSSTDAGDARVLLA